MFTKNENKFAFFADRKLISINPNELYG